jgi:glutamate racemase
LPKDKPEKNCAIGVFDSGLGGLTVVKALRQTLPHEEIIYLGDTARVPYGNKSASLVKEYALQIATFLREHAVKMIVVACNTASATALPTLQAQFPIPIVDVIHPGVKAALKQTRNNHVGVIGTLATIRSGAYTKTLKKNSATVQVVSQACPLFVPLAEEGWLEGPVPEEVAKHYLKPFKKDTVDTLILGCTHYPLLKPIIKRVLGPTPVLIDSAEAVAEEVARTLTKDDLVTTHSSPGTLHCFVTDLPLHFQSIVRRFLGMSIDHVQTVHLP